MNPNIILANDDIGVCYKHVLFTELNIEEET